MRAAPILLTGLMTATGALWGQEDPRALMLQARSLQRRTGGDEPEKAVQLYRKAIALEPESSEAHLRLAEALAECADLEGAIKASRRATQLNPKNGEAWAAHGMLLYNKGRVDKPSWSEALPVLQRASRLLPSDADVLIRLAEVAESEKRDDIALDTWLRLGRARMPLSFQGRSLTDIALERATILSSKLKKFSARREALLALCDRPQADPRHLRLLEELAREQVQAGFLAHAEESFTLLARHVPNEPGLFENIALVQFQAGRYELAKENLSKAEALRPSAGVSFHLALSLMNLGELPQAEKRLRALLSEESGRTDEGKQRVGQSRELLASVLLLQGRPQDVRALIPTWPDFEANPTLLAALIQSCIQSEQWKEARTWLKMGMAKFPDRGLFQTARLVPEKVLMGGLFQGAASRKALAQLDLEAMAGLWAEFRQWKQSLERVQAARKAAPVRDVELLLLQSNALEQLGRWEEAMAVLREGQRLNSDHPVLQNNLGYLLLERGGDLKEAADLIEKAVKRDGHNGSTMDSWGWALFKLGRVAEAETALRRAVELSPFSPEIRKHLGDVLLKLQKHEEALEQWERALAYAFPDRPNLEKRVKDLRIEVAKKRMETDEPLPPTEEAEPEEGDEL